jgi:hypothetical protein
VVCTTCYFKAGVTGQLSIDGKFDLDGTLNNLTAQFEGDFKNLTTAGVSFLNQELQNVQGIAKEVESLTKTGNLNFDNVVNAFANFNNVTFDVNITAVPPPLPEVQLLFQIDHLDLYVELDAIISAHAQINIPLYKSQGPLGVSVGSDLEIGFFVTMDLILSVDGELDIRSGFHLLLDKPVGFHIDMFGNDVSNVIL